MDLKYKTQMCWTVMATFIWYSTVVHLYCTLDSILLLVTNFLNSLKCPITQLDDQYDYIRKQNGLAIEIALQFKTIFGLNSIMQMETNIKTKKKLC